MRKIRKRVFAAVLAALVLVTAMPGTEAYAVTTTVTVQEDAIVSVTVNGIETKYTSPEGFVDAVKGASGEVSARLLQTVDLGNAELTVPDGVTLTLNCGECTLTGSGPQTVWVEGTFNFTGGTIRNTGDLGCAIVVGGYGASFHMSGGLVDCLLSGASYAVTSVFDNNTITITGGTVGKEGHGLGVGGGTVMLSGGTYSSIYPGREGVYPNFVANPVSSVLDEGYALRGEDGVFIRGDITGIQKNVTVVSCTHTGAVNNLGNGTHSINCPYCAYTGQSENCNYTFSGNTGTCETCGDALTVSVTGTANLIYDGIGKEPEVTVRRGGTVLDASKYNVTYSGNVNAGNNTASVTVSGTGGTNWSCTQNFTIKKAALTITASGQEITYGQSITQGVDRVTADGLCSVDSLDGITLTASSDQVAAENKTIIPSAANIRNGSSQDVTGNYEITYEKGKLTINKATGTLTVPETAIRKKFGDEEFSLDCTSNVGGTIACTSSNEGVALVSADGKVQIKGVGAANITVSLAESANYTGDKKTVTVTVEKADAPSAKNELKQYIHGKGSGGKTVEMDITEKFPSDRGKTVYSCETSDGEGLLSGVNIDGNGKLTYQVKTGTKDTTASITVTAEMDNYENAEFVLTIKLVDKIQVEITAEPENAVYDGSRHKGYAGEPTCGYPVEGYTFTYRGREGTEYNSSEPPEDAGSYTVTISVSDNSGDYEGESVSLDFTIAKATVTIKADNQMVKKGAPLPELTYTVSGLAEKDCLAAEPEVTCSADTKTEGSYPITVSGGKVPDTKNYNGDITYENGTLTVTKSANDSSSGSNSSGGSNGTGGTDTPGNPQEPEPAPDVKVKSVKLSKTVYTYTGKAIKPSVTAVDTDGKQISAKYYTVSYKNNKNVGKATVNVKFKDGYSGRVTKTFTIRPVGTSIKKLTAASGGFTVKWTKKTKQTSGYQIQYSTNAEFKENSTSSVFVKKASVTKKTVKKLKAGKKYYVRIRTYRTVKTGGKSTRIYSAWSRAVRVETLPAAP